MEHRGGLISSDRGPGFVCGRFGCNCVADKSGVQTPPDPRWWRAPDFCDAFRLVGPVVMYETKTSRSVIVGMYVPELLSWK